MCFYDYLYTGSNNKGQEFTNLCLAGRMKMDFRIFDKNNIILFCPQAHDQHFGKITYASSQLERRNIPQPITFILYLDHIIQTAFRLQLRRYI